MPSSADSGFFDSPISRTQSLVRRHSLLPPRYSISRQSFHLLSHKGEEAQPGPCRPSQSVRSTMLNMSSSPTKATKKAKSSSKSKSKASKKSGTILRAVGPATLLATAPLSPLERDMATLPNHEVLSSIGISPDSDDHPSLRNVQLCTLSRNPTRSRSTTTSPLKAGTDTRFFSTSTDLKDTIGHYKHGKIEWEQKETSGSRSSSPGKSQRPRIQVIIPGEKFNRPLPATPFFSPSKDNGHVQSASADVIYTAGVSPPSVTSASKKVKIRDSIVSPLSAQQQQHRPLRHFLPSIKSNIPEVSEVPTHTKNNSLSNSSSEDSNGDDSSTSSKRSSLTSIEATPPLKSKSFKSDKQPATAANAIHSPVEARIFLDEASMTQKPVAVLANAGSSVPAPNSSRPRRYAHHPPIEEDAFFIRTCEIQPKRSIPQITIDESPTLPRRRSSARHSVYHGMRRRSVVNNPAMGMLNRAFNRSQSKHLRTHVPSPTLSEAENDLEQELTAIESDNPFKWDDLVSKKNAKAAVTATPPVPRKSSKRMSEVMRDNFRLSRVPGDHIASQMRRRTLLARGKSLKLSIPQKSKRLTEDFELSPIAIQSKATKRGIKPADAEHVIYTILTKMESLDDLFATAVVNQGFYRVFKRHELELTKSALRKMSPPAWEHREICYPGHDHHDPEELEIARPRQEYTPNTYLQYYTRDMYIIAELKFMIQEKCHSFVRPELAEALDSNDIDQSMRIDDALWRIWTFCKIFGCDKGREEDIVAQMDWLKGGELVHQKTCTQSIFTTDAFNDTLASAPDCFAKGNDGGLTAEQLFDMMELWNCLGVLLQPFEGRTIPAREHGVYDNTEVRGGDIDGEEVMLDEWCYYLLTLGLSPILDLATLCRQPDSTAFIIAAENGWVRWKAPVLGGTRRNFLKEAASRVYEDKIATIYAESSTKEVQRQLSKQRIQRHITELRKRKNNGENLVEIRMSQERPISEWDSVINNLNRPRLPQGANIVTHVPQLRSIPPVPTPVLSHFPPIPEVPGCTPQTPVARPRSPLRRIVAEPLLPSPPPSTIAPSVAASIVRPRSPPRRIIAEPLLPSPPPSTVAPSVADWETRSIATMPSIEEHPSYQRQSVPALPSLSEHPAFAEHLRQMAADANALFNSIPVVVDTSAPALEEQRAFLQHPLQREILSSNPADNTADKAVYRIVEMGFTPEQARQALRITDLGDGLRVDRAVELLLRGHM